MEILKIILGIIFIFGFVPLGITGISYLFQIIEIGKKDKIDLIVFNKNEYEQGEFKSNLIFRDITLDKAMFLKSVFENNGKTCYLTILSQEPKKKQKEKKEQCEK